MRRPHIGNVRTVAILLFATAAWGAAGCSDDALLIPDPAVRYVAFGDSSTAGRSGRDYPDILSELLGLPAGVMAKQGKGGETTSEGLERLRLLRSRGIYPNAHTLLYWEGGGDIIGLIREVDGLLLFSPLDPGYPHAGRLAETLDRAQANIETAIAETKAAGLTVYVATYFTSREAVADCDPLLLDVILPSQAHNANGYVALLNERIRLAVANGGAVLVDVATLDEQLHADPANFLDCNHLSAGGNAIVAQLFANVINQHAAPQE